MIQIGEVVDGPADNMNRPVLDGVQYDYVFDVDIGDGEPIRKLPYNRADNPYITADKWLLKENLPLSYRQQIVEFILQNSGQKDFVLDASFHDPYTGGQNTDDEHCDVKATNAYTPGQPSDMSDSLKKPAFKHIPKKGMLFFDAAQFDGILKKVTEFNNTIASSAGQSNLSLTEPEMSRLTAITKILKDTSHYHCTRFADVDIALLVKLLNRLFSGIDNDHQVLDALSTCCLSSNKNVNLSYSTLVLNYAVLLIEKKDQEGQAQVLSAALEIAEGSQDIDSKFRALVAIGGSVVVLDVTTIEQMLDGLVKTIAIDFDVQSIAQAAIDSKEVKIAEVGADIELIIKG
ncbi:hypothetical protein ACLOJK_041126 [Asimina triloba]